MNNNATSPLTWTTSAASDQGRRTENQDRMTRFVTPFGELVVVADGMGGMKGGATAAATVTGMLPELIRQMPPTTQPVEALRMAVQSINEQIYRQGHSGDPALAKMGTTLVLALLRDNGETLVANVGDSRAYLFRNGNLLQLTKDHSAVQRLVDAGAISPEQARTHPEASVLTRAIGQQPDVQLEVYTPFRLEPGDGLLLCSDGLSGFTGDANITEILRQYADPASAVKALGQHALEAGSDDNITIQYLRVNSPSMTIAASIPPLPIWRQWAPYAAAAVALLAIAVPIYRYEAHVPVLEIRIGNATGEIAPKPNELPPDKPQPKQKQPEPKRKETAKETQKEKPAEEAKPSGTFTGPKAKVVVFHGEDRPAWLSKDHKLDCVEFRPRKHADLPGRMRALDPYETHILYRSGAAAAKDCMLAHIPELNGAQVTQVPILPNNADIVIILPVSDTEV